MLNAANLNFIAFWRYGPHPEALTGILFAIFSIGVAAAEAAVGLAMIIADLSALQDDEPGLHRFHEGIGFLSEIRDRRKYEVVLEHLRRDELDCSKPMADSRYCRCWQRDSAPAPDSGSRVFAASLAIGSMALSFLLSVCRACPRLRIDRAGNRRARRLQLPLVPVRQRMAAARLGARSADRRHAGDGHLCRHC